MKAFLFTILLWLQIQPVVPVTLQVRYLDGSPFEQPIQIRDDEGEPLQVCEPDADGRCTVELMRGLYLVEPTGTQLDALSAAAAVEIGGRWLAITVGEEPLDYGFVIAEGAVYFDETPNAERPQPFRPTQADLDAHFSNEGAAENSVYPTPPASTSVENQPTQGVTLEERETESAELPSQSGDTTVTNQTAETSARRRLLRWCLFLLLCTIGSVGSWWLTTRRYS